MKIEFFFISITAVYDIHVFKCSKTKKLALDGKEAEFN